MVNFSVIGRNCTVKDRDDYEEWDTINGERSLIKDTLEKEFPELDVFIGGAISVDITYKNKGKEQVALKVRNKYPNHEIIFFGDKTDIGGNDYTLACKLNTMNNTKVIPVKSYHDIVDYIYKRGK